MSCRLGRFQIYLYLSDVKAIFADWTTSPPAPIFHSAKVYNLNQKLNFVQIWYKWKIIKKNNNNKIFFWFWHKKLDTKMDYVTRLIFWCIFPPFWIWIGRKCCEGERGGFKWRGGSPPPSISIQLHLWSKWIRLKIYLRHIFFHNLPGLPKN